MPRRLVAPPLCANASPQLRLARLLLNQMHTLSHRECKRRLQALRASDQVKGPLALNWLFSALARRCGPGKDRVFFLEQADIVMEEAIAMRKVKKGHSQYGLTPWEVVHWKPPAWLPRYDSCPVLPSQCQTARSL